MLLKGQKSKTSQQREHTLTQDLAAMGPVKMEGNILQTFNSDFVAALAIRCAQIKWKLHKN